MPAEYVFIKQLSRRGFLSWVWVLVVAIGVWGCVPRQGANSEQQTSDFMAEHTKGAIDGSVDNSKKAESAEQNQLPVRYQTPSYQLAPSASVGTSNTASDVAIPVGAKIAPAGPKPLRMVMQELAKLKSMNISWANDVDQDALVHVTIMPEEDFFEAIDNVLRQLDYFHEMQGNTIVVRHKETKKFHVAMPFMSSSYSTGVGGDVLGNTEGSNMSGTLNLNSSDNKFDIWANIEKNLDKILEIWSVPPPPVVAAAPPAAPAANQPAAAPAVPAPAVPVAASSENSGRSGLGYYTIDRPIGLISVTAPRSLLGKIENYLNNLRSEIYRQVSIEAKIIEITLDGDNTTGLDWSSLLNMSLGGALDPGRFRVDTGVNNSRTTTTFHQDASNSLSQTGPDSSISISGSSGTITGPDSSITVVGPNQATSSSTDTLINSGSILTQRFLTMAPVSFNLLIDAMKEQGHVEVLSSPKISVMNGQPAMISVGENVAYIKSVSSTTDKDTGTISYTVTPDSVMSGLGLGVIATIMENDQIILNLTPVTSALTQLDYKTVGSNQVGLPRVSLREMNTMVRVKNGEMLVVGGLTDTNANYRDTSVAGLGALPGPLGKLFRKDGTVSRKRELVILLRPRLISL